MLIQNDVNNAVSLACNLLARTQESALVLEETLLYPIIERNPTFYGLLELSTSQSSLLIGYGVVPNLPTHFK